MNADMLQFTLTTGEAQVLDAASHIRYGELINVSLTSADQPSVSRLIPKASAAFVDKIRQEGITYFHSIVVHNGSPTQAEVNGRYGPIEYHRKIRIQ